MALRLVNTRKDGNDHERPSKHNIIQLSTSNAINIYALPFIRYAAGTVRDVRWTKENMEVTDVKTRKPHTKASISHENLHLNSNIQRLFEIKAGGT